jgi:hypothetical protein
VLRTGKQVGVDGGGVARPHPGNLRHAYLIHEAMTAQAGHELFQLGLLGLLGRSRACISSLRPDKA